VRVIEYRPEQLPFVLTQERGRLERIYALALRGGLVGFSQLARDLSPDVVGLTRR
jgi:hypothetical protein